MAAQASCSGSSGMCSGGSGTLSGTVFDAPTSAPLALPLVALQKGNLDPPYSDLSKADPSYTLGKQANYHGNFSVTLPCGNYGLHVYMPGYHAFGAEVANGPTAKVAMEPLDPNEKLPVLGTPHFGTTSIHPNTQVTLEVPVTAGDPNDPLTSQVVFLNPAVSRAQALDPPSAGTADGFPDGVWRTTIAAPSLGTYACTVVAVSKAGVTGVVNFALAVVH